MDYLQYLLQNLYKLSYLLLVLNLVINGLPSILRARSTDVGLGLVSFKPCYKWITFNTLKILFCHIKEKPT